MITAMRKTATKHEKKLASPLVIVLLKVSREYALTKLLGKNEFRTHWFISIKHSNNFAASTAKVGRPDPINHTHGDLLIACLLTLCMCTSSPTHSVTFGRAHLVAQKGVGGYKYINNGTSGFTVPREACRNELAYFLLSTWCERGVGRDERWREKDLDSMRARDTENKGKLFTGLDPVARAPHWPFIDWLI